MGRRRNVVCFSFMLVLLFGIAGVWAEEQPVKVEVHWDHVIRVSRTTPTLLLGASPVLMRGAPLRERILQKVKDLGADDVRYAGAGYVYPHLGVVELEPPTATTTSWDFSFIDPVTEDVMKALEGHPVYSTSPPSPHGCSRRPNRSPTRQIRRKKHGITAKARNSAIPLTARWPITLPASLPGT